MELVLIDIIQNLKLISREEALINIHFPKDKEILQRSQSRLKFDELFFIQLNLINLKYIRIQKYKGHKFSVVGDYLNNFFYNIDIL